MMMSTGRFKQAQRRAWAHEPGKVKGDRLRVYFQKWIVLVRCQTKSKEWLYRDQSKRL